MAGEDGEGCAGVCYNLCMSIVVRRPNTLSLLVAVAALICAFYLGMLYEGAGTSSATLSGSDKRSPVEQRSERINAMKVDPSLPIDNVRDLESVLPDAERIQLYEAARTFVAQHSVQGMDFSLMFEFKKGDFINFDVIPENTVADHVQLYMQKVDGKWVAEDLGSLPPVPYDELPKL
jgi:hypothetical protein